MRDGVLLVETALDVATLWGPDSFMAEMTRLQIDRPEVYGRSPLPFEVESRLFEKRPEEDVGGDPRNPDAA